MAKVLLESGNYRLVDGAGCYHVEKNDGADALGVTRWGPVEKVSARGWERGEEESPAEIPADVFRAMCERIKEKVSL